MPPAIEVDRRVAGAEEDVATPSRSDCPNDRRPPPGDPSAPGPRRAGRSPSGISVASGMCPAAHSSGWRTSRTKAPASRSASASAVETSAGRGWTATGALWAGVAAGGAAVGVAGEQAATNAAAPRTRMERVRRGANRRRANGPGTSAAAPVCVWCRRRGGAGRGARGTPRHYRVFAQSCKWWPATSTSPGGLAFRATPGGRSPRRPPGRRSQAQIRRSDARNLPRARSGTRADP